MPGKHELQIALATARREANSLHVRLRSETARADRCAMDLAETLDALSKSTDRTIAAQKECDAARAEAQRLQEALAAARGECQAQRKCDVEPHLRTEDEIRELQPRVDFMAERMCQTQGMVLWALKEAGLTVVLLDPSAREIAPDGAALAAPAAGCPTCGCTPAKDPGVPCSDSWHDLRAEMGS